MFKAIKKHAVISAILVFGLAVLAAPAAAVSADWSIFGSLMDSDDLAEAFGGGIRVSFPVKENVSIDVQVSYYEDFKNRFEDNTGDRLSVELSTIPLDFGFTWTKNGSNGFQIGGGFTYGYMDINDLNIEAVSVPITGNANDQFGGYLKFGYQAEGGFFGEIFYRILEVDVKSVTLGGVPADNIDIQLDGFTINLGWRF